MHGTKGSIAATAFGGSHRNFSSLDACPTWKSQLGADVTSYSPGFYAIAPYLSIILAVVFIMIIKLHS